MLNQACLVHTLHALAAFQESFCSMNFQMFLPVGCLIEFFGTAINRACKRLLQSMNSKMVKEVIPTSEQLSASIVVAREALIQTSGPSIPEYYFCELSRIWNLLLFLK
jgi:hypothetical protein